MLTRQKRNFYKVLFVFGVDTKNINVIFFWGGGGGIYTLATVRKDRKGLKKLTST